MESKLVSVCLITYNHGRFIEQAIQSVLDQTHAFDWEIIIADDFSADETTVIVESFSEQFPDLIRPILQNPNVGPDLNFKELLNAANGKYIAYLEGDDYWTDPAKLQKQVDFLEANPEFSACFHDVEVQYLNREKRSHKMISDDRDVFTFEDVLAKNFSVPTCSLVFRNEPADFSHSLIMLDWVLRLLLAKRGKVKRLDGTMAVYRQHAGGWTNKNWTQKALELVEITRRCREYFGPEHTEAFDRILAHDHADVCFGYFQDGNTEKFLESYREMSGLMHLLSDRKRRALEFRKSLANIPTVARGYSNLANRYREFIFLRRRGI